MIQYVNRIYGAVMNTLIFLSWQVTLNAAKTQEEAGELDLRHEQLQDPDQQPRNVIMVM